MYNLKVLKYPSGWQIRVYDEFVGIKDNKPYVKNPDSHIYKDYVWDYESQEYYLRECEHDKFWYNIFTQEYERYPKEMKEPDKERSAKVSMNRTVNKVYHLARSNIWDWFFTLTFDPEKVDSFDYSACTKSLSKWLNNLRRVAPELKYIAVPEKHKSGRFHFHGLFAGCEGIEFIESGHYTKSGDIIYNIGSYKLGFSTATRVKDNSKVTKYISKYITKDLCAVSFGKKRYWASRNLDDVKGEEFKIMTQKALEEIKERLSKKCLFHKTVQSDIVTVDYFEMEVPENGTIPE